jgi:hypothetical protein
MKHTITIFSLWRGLGTVLLAGTMMASTGWGAPSLGTDSFDTPNDTSGWEGVGTEGQSFFTTPHPMFGGHDNGYIELLFPANAINPFPQDGAFFNRDANHTGDYSTVSVSFDFKVDPVVNEAVGLSVYFMSGVNMWTKQFVVPANQWSRVTVNFSNPWETSTGVDFVSDVMAVEEIGVMVTHFNNDSQWSYGLDNWTVSVPEPETYALILVTLLSLGITFRSAIGGFFRRRHLGGVSTA